MDTELHKYTYDGPVICFGKYIGNWHGETIAKTRDKAKSNLLYQCKKSCNKIPGAGGLSLEERKIKQLN